MPFNKMETTLPQHWLVYYDFFTQRFHTAMSPETKARDTNILQPSKTCCKHVKSMTHTPFVRVRILQTHNNFTAYSVHLARHVPAWVCLPHWLTVDPTQAKRCIIIRKEEILRIVSVKRSDFSNAG